MFALVSQLFEENYWTKVLPHRKGPFGEFEGFLVYRISTLFRSLMFLPLTSGPTTKLLGSIGNRAAVSSQMVDLHGSNSLVHPVASSPFSSRALVRGERERERENKSKTNLQQQSRNSSLGRTPKNLAPPSFPAAWRNRRRYSTVVSCCQ